jgi:DNA-binding NtrC family response regulator
MANILVVDDEMGIRELLSEILGDEGHVVTTAQNAQEARDLLKSSSPDLILLDIWMPDTDGVTLLKEWQRDNALSMPVIMMSGHATIDTAVEATRIGALNFLEKPIALQKLLKTVQQGLSHNKEPIRPVSYLRSPAIATSATLQQTQQPPASFSPPPPVYPGHSAPAQFSPQATNTASISFDLPLREARDAFERAYFEYHLARENGSMTRVAERTGLERTHLYRKLKQLGVEPGKAARRAVI